MEYIHVLHMSYDLYVLSRFYHLRYMNTDAWWLKPDADLLQYVPWVIQVSDPISKLVESTFLWGFPCKCWQSLLDISMELRTQWPLQFCNTVESLEFVVAQFSWNSWVPLIHEFTSTTKWSVKFLFKTLMKKGMVCNTPYCINKPACTYN